MHRTKARFPGFDKRRVYPASEHRSGGVDHGGSARLWCLCAESMSLQTKASPPRASEAQSIRRILRVRGVVQGVGFRPFAHRLASELSLSGSVGNAPDHVLIDLEGSHESVTAFERRLIREGPARAVVESVVAEDAPPRGRTGFAILASAAGEMGSPRVSADIATCAACVAEMLDPANRRFGYAFINCTDCGPRYSISRDVPYDRARTTMNDFTMCQACTKEYENPTSRRFHAQPNACPSCGPRLWAEPEESQDPVEAAARALGRGEIIAAKGLSGFHLVCDATNAMAVRDLRDRKGREQKPFAVMFRDLEAVCRVAIVDEVARAALLSPQRPIVLLRSLGSSQLVSEISPGLSEVGAFLPATPLQHLLLRRHGGPLVMTSGNAANEPIVISNEEARTRLRAFTDLILMHNRDIHMREDDSVVRVVCGETRVFRRARG
ncbi:MAG: Sua5/YciO/YrdC/YwlC family protein, partial [Vicinamibacteria bacterium]